MSSRVEIYLDLERLPGLIGENVTAAIASRIVRNARATVRVDSHALQGTIQSIPVTQTKHIVVAETEYAAAQEYGLEPFGKPNYGYTPYMEPSIEYVMQQSVLTPLVLDAYNGAIEKARRRQTLGR